MANSKLFLTNLIYATLIDLLGLILLYVSNAIFKLGIGALFILACYSITWKKFKDQFWWAFFISFVLGFILMYISFFFI